MLISSERGSELTPCSPLIYFQEIEKIYSMQHAVAYIWLERIFAIQEQNGIAFLYKISVLRELK